MVQEIKEEFLIEDINSEIAHDLNEQNIDEIVLFDVLGEDPLPLILEN